MAYPLQTCQNRINSQGYEGRTFEYEWWAVSLRDYKLSFPNNSAIEIKLFQKVQLNSLGFLINIAENDYEQANVGCTC